MLTVFTDGSSRGNPGRGGWALIAFNEEIVVEQGGNETQTTNNRMEMKGIIEGLRLGKEMSMPVHIFTDSSYVLKGATQWLSGWRERGWMTSQKQPVLNQDLWEEMDELLKNVTHKFTLVKGHAGNVLNERADEIATSFADRVDIDLFQGKRELYTPLKAGFEKPESQASSPAGSSHKSGKAYSYISMINGDVLTHRSWSECEERVKGVRGARFKKSFSPEDERIIIADFKSKAP